MFVIHGKTKQLGEFMKDKILSASARQRALTEFNLLKDLVVKCKECNKTMRRHTQDDNWYYYCDDCARNVFIEMPKYLD